MTRLINTTPKPPRDLTNQDVINYLISIGLEPIEILVENNRVQYLEVKETLTASQITIIKTKYTELT